MLMPVQLNSFTHLRVLLVLTDRGMLAQSNINVMLLYHSISLNNINNKHAYAGQNE
jgi:hypothetical protein